jgi:hypothetical protein
MAKLAPFIYGRPVSPDRFIDRLEVTQTLFSRISVGDSTAVVGEPHIGKSSLLHYVQSPHVRSEWLEDKAGNFLFSAMDCHLLAGDFSPADFWRRALAPLTESPLSDDVIHQLDIVGQNDFGAFSLETLFKLLAQSDHCLVLLIDEFDTMLHHPNFNKAEFFGALRALATGTDGLALVTATRQSVHDMIILTQALNPYGSPFFNQFTELNLGYFDDIAIRELLAQALSNSAIQFDDRALAFLRRIAGRHPYLLQAGGAALYEAVSRGLAGEELYLSATKAFCHSTAAHFADFWSHLTPAAQTALAILALGEVQGQLDRRAFDTGDMGKLDIFRSELEKLVEIGVVEEVTDKGLHFDWGNFVLWRDRQWRIAAGGFVWWFADSVITRTRAVIPWDEWVEQREYEGLLTRGEKDRLRELAAKIPKDTFASVAKLARTFLEGLLHTA